MGKRSRARARGEGRRAPSADYTDGHGNVLTLRGSMTPKTRARYATISGEQSSAATAEDRWHREVEFLFERLAVVWVIAGVPTDDQAELLARFRVASDDERRWIRDVLRKHLAENFPDVEGP